MAQAEAAAIAAVHVEVDELAANGDGLGEVREGEHHHDEVDLMHAVPLAAAGAGGGSNADPSASRTAGVSLD